MACLGIAVLLSAALLWVLRVDRTAVGFVCALMLLGGLIPLAAEFFRKRSFYLRQNIWQSCAYRSREHEKRYGQQHVL